MGTIDGEEAPGRARDRQLASARGPSVAGCARALHKSGHVLLIQHRAKAASLQLLQLYYTLHSVQFMDTSI